MFNWFRERSRKKLLQTPFPEGWKTILLERVAHYSYLSDDEQAYLEELICFFIAEKNFEGCGGLEITNEIKVIIAAEASLLVLGLPSFQYKGLQSVLVYPTTITLPQRRPGVFSEGLSIVPDRQAILGQAMLNGPVVLVWDAVLRDARHPERGHNVVYHEFAHILDMRDGMADGTPELHSTKLFREWVDICSKEYFRLQKRTAEGKKTLLDSYGAVHEAEFFAVATELFFDRPRQMRRERPELYNVLSAYYRQDTAARKDLCQHLK
ncbi:MAG: Mlc titration factor MtfA (ptsG expression regulator) [Desulforhopalus sp.]|jgi:Mlc titration factor MtfA (ptsG expression regulator)